MWRCKTYDVTLDKFGRRAQRLAAVDPFNGSVTNAERPIPGDVHLRHGRQVTGNATATSLSVASRSRATPIRPPRTSDPAPAAAARPSRSSSSPGIDIEKTTNGPTNSNPTAPDYDNEDAANGPGVPILTPGSTVTWTYKVTNTGGVAFRVQRSRHRRRQRHARPTRPTT